MLRGSAIESGVGALRTLRSRRLATVSTHGLLAAIGVLLLYAAAGPIATDDLWWHLALGRLYAVSGPWLDADPRLHTALGPPPPSAWLFDLGVARLVDVIGLQGLRALHLAAVAGLLAGFWRTLRRLSGSPLCASLGTAVFAASAAYRLLQLRPSLATIGLSLGLVVLLVIPKRPAWSAVGLGAGLCGLWAHLHPGFPLGPGLLIVAALALVVDGLGPARSPAISAAQRGKALRLGLAALLGLLATGTQPAGFAALAGTASAGAGEVASGLVIDEWRSLSLLSWPTPRLPPTPLAWLCSVLVLVATIGSLIAWGRASRSPRAPADPEQPAEDRFLLEPCLAALALVGVTGPLVAVRFQWMSLFALLWLARFIGSRAGSRSPSPWLAMVASTLLLIGTVQGSAWTLLAPRVGLARYLEPYDADRYYAQGVWFLEDAGVRGRLFNVYFMGGFLGYWLSPGLQTFVDGSLNFPTVVLADHQRIVAADGPEEGGSLGALLDRYQIDFFVGVGLPVPARPGRPWRYTAAHLERDRDWLLVHRGLRSAIYLRRARRNEDNLARITQHYEAAGVPFDPAEGLDVERVLFEATNWAIEHGMAPIDFPELVTVAEEGRGAARRIARSRLAATYAALGLYAHALEIDTAPERAAAGFDADRARRRIWLALRLDHAAQASRHADALARRNPGDPLSGQLIAAARAYAATRDPVVRARISAVTPVFSQREAGALRFVERPAPVRDP